MKSVVAVIFTPDGGMRVVIDQATALYNHLTEGEQLVIIPDFNVEEPVAWDEIPTIIAIAENYLKKWHTLS